MEPDKQSEVPTSIDLVGLLESLGGTQHLEREKAAARWTASLNSLKPELFEGQSEEIKAKVILMLESKRWEERHGALFAVTELFRFLDLNTESNLGFKMKLLELLKVLLNDPEFRVRIAVGNVLKSLVQKEGITIYDLFKESLYKIIENAFAQEEETKKEPALGKTQEPAMGPEKESKKEAEGWGYLETTMRTIQRIAEGIGAAFLPCLDEKLLSFIEQAANHPNRYLREIGLSLSSTLFEISDLKFAKALGPRFAPLIKQGLTDTWPQVRYAGCVAGKSFFALGGQDPDFCKAYYPILLPALCINRYYIAEGIRLLSLGIWKSIVGEKGRDHVLEYLDSFVEYYVSQTTAESYAVRESACHCIAELCTKVAALSKEKVKGFAKTMLEALINCMKDSCWSVRNAACAASGKLVLEFPEESESRFEELTKLWSTFLSDNFNAVRENSATSLANAARVFGKQGMDVALGKLEELLPMAKKQPPESAHEALSHHCLPKGAHIKHIMNITDLIHGGPPSKPEASTKEGSFPSEKISEPWESSDGAIHLLNELSAVCPKEVAKYLPGLAELTNLDHFHHAMCMRETIYLYLPTIMKNVGKPLCKANLEYFFDGLFKSVKGQKQGTIAAASECLYALGKFIGPTILKGRIAEYRPEYAEEYEMILKRFGTTK